MKDVKDGRVRKGGRLHLDPISHALTTSVPSPKMIAYKLCTIVHQATIQTLPTLWSAPYTRAFRVTRRQYMDVYEVWDVNNNQQPQNDPVAFSDQKQTVW